MSNVFKFRVWDFRNGKFLEDRWNGISFLYNGVWEGIGYFMNNPDFDVNPSTGLADKHGNDVFEGDIINCKGYDDWFDLNGFFYKREVKNVISINERDDGKMSSGYQMPKDIEIIGNIQENANLLQKI